MNEKVLDTPLFSEAFHKISNELKPLILSQQKLNIIAVSKKQSKEKIFPALEFGHQHFGENQFQEAETKWLQLKENYPEVLLHFLGRIQSNKAKQIIHFFDYIHTLDREKIANIFHEEINNNSLKRNLFIQINTGEEEQKGGVTPNEVDDFFAFCRDLNLPVIGFMCIPPAHQPASLHFAYMKQLHDRFSINELSMGMTQDYKIAAKMGATFIRIGTALFGKRS